MKTTVTKQDFFDRFTAYDRRGNFSDNALSALFNYIEEWEASTGEELELDIIALCCEFTEYSSVEEACEEYGDDINSVEDLRDRTQVIAVDGGGVIIQDF